jgi:hypothetical protein
MDASTAVWIVLLYAVGLALPVAGLIRAYLKTSRRRVAVVDALAAHRELGAWFRAENQRLMEPGLSDVVGEQLKDLYAERARRQAALPQKPGTYGTAKEQLGADTGLTDLAAAVVAARWDFVLVGIGLASATAASIWATLASVG